MEIPWNNLESYLTASSPSSQGNLWINQAHWQYDTDSIVAGMILGSSIIQDNSKSDVNRRVARMIANGRFKQINFLEVDKICDGGAELQQALEHFQIVSKA